MVGGVLGGFIFDWINILDIGDLLDPLIAGALGAAVLLALAGFVRPAAPTPTA
ncbi:MAG: GlsB/YeaQ/YmgE family stress response membrane protein [Chloroflexi bacterium]|nr:MAG: GlsB/YeaQ/YmgE family stress response membrane protein [Chloroflexota bacterium]